MSEPYEDYGAQQAALEDEHTAKFGRRHSHDRIDDVWTGDLAGWRVGIAALGDIPHLAHDPCGTTLGIMRPPSHTGSHYELSGYLANIVNEALEHTCPDTK